MKRRLALTPIANAAKIVSLAWSENRVEELAAGDIGVWY
jgi:hypothetical protein